MAKSTADQNLYLIVFERRADPPPPYLDLFPLLANKLQATALFNADNGESWLIRSSRSARSLFQEIKDALHGDDALAVLPLGRLIRDSTFAGQGFMSDIEIL